MNGDTAGGGESEPPEPPDPPAGEPSSPEGAADGAAGPTAEEEERHRLRRTARHLIFSAAAVAIFAAAFLAISLWAPRRDAPPNPPPPSPSPSPPVVTDNLTVLIQATTRDGAMGSMLTAVQPAASGSRAVLLSLPSDLVVAAPGAEQQVLSQTVASLDTLAPTAALAATLGVHIDASWRLDRKALAGLVDSVNGVTVDVERRLRIRDEDGELVVNLRPGVQRLAGTTASWYAVGNVVGGEALAQAERFADVLGSTLARLPDDDLAIRESLTALGTLAPSTIGTQELASYLQELAAAVRPKPATITTLPTTAIQFDDDALRWTEFARATPLLRRLLPDSLWQPGVDGPPRVLVQVPPARPGWIGYVRNQLAGSGFVFVDGRGTSDAGSRTALLVRGDPRWAQQLEVLLTIPRSATTVVAAPTTPPPRGRPWADVDVTLGPTYVPGVGDPRVARSSPGAQLHTGGTG